MDHLDRSRLYCAGANCQFLVHSDPEFGGYCCRKCHWRTAVGSRTKNKHGQLCERVVAPEDSQPAPPIPPEDAMSWSGYADTTQDMSTEESTQRPNGAASSSGQSAGLASAPSPRQEVQQLAAGVPANESERYTENLRIIMQGAERCGPEAYVAVAAAALAEIHSSTERIRSSSTFQEAPPPALCDGAPPPAVPSRPQPPHHSLRAGPRGQQAEESASGGSSGSIWNWGHSARSEDGEAAPWQQEEEDQQHRDNQEARRGATDVDDVEAWTDDEVVEVAGSHPGSADEEVAAEMQDSEDVAEARIEKDSQEEDDDDDDWGEWKTNQVKDEEDAVSDDLLAADPRPVLPLSAKGAPPTPPWAVTPPARHGPSGAPELASSTSKLAAKARPRTKPQPRPPPGQQEQEQEGPKKPKPPPGPPPGHLRVQPAQPAALEPLQPAQPAAPPPEHLLKRQRVEESMTVCRVTESVVVRRVAETMTVPIAKVRYLQDSIAPRFSNGRPLEELIDELMDGVHFPLSDSFLELQAWAVDDEDIYYTLDHRRLFCMQQAHCQFVKLRLEGTANSLQSLTSLLRKAHPGCFSAGGGTSIQVRG